MGNDAQYTWQRDLYKTHIDTIRGLDDKYFHIMITLGKSVQTISAGALLLSMTFVKQLFPSPSHKGLLFFAWLGFGLTLLMSLLAVYLSSFAMRKQIALTNGYFIQLRNAENPEKIMVEKNPIDIYICISNNVIAALLLLSFTTLGFFIYYNY